MFKNRRILKNGRKLLRRTYRLYRRREEGLSEEARGRIRELLKHLQRAVLAKNSEETLLFADQLVEARERYLPLSPLAKFFEGWSSLLLALLFALLIRQMSFEFYIIPTGSMRPTLRESDYLLVSKTKFGINWPLSTGHLYFDPDLVDRGDIVVFTSEGLELPDTDTLYFYLIPGKKQFVKRLIGKGGDRILFYGGAIYGIDAQGNPLPPLQAPWIGEHIPFIRFEGEVDTEQRGFKGVYSPVTLYQYNEPVARLTYNPLGVVQGELIGIAAGLNVYSDLLGINDFAMVRILDGKLLEMRHHPSVQSGRLIQDELGRLRPDLAVSFASIPLTSLQIDRIARHLTTSRFEVKGGKAFRPGGFPTRYSPEIPIADGTYEMIDGTAYQIYWAGLSKALEKDHPIYRFPILLFNFGIELDTRVTAPCRYVYYKNGDLCLFGSPLFTKNELAEFTCLEEIKATPFLDPGAPTPETIAKQGILVPEKTYLVLGDNYANSADSRVFGFVPEENLRGGVSLLFWPPSSRLGSPPQPTAPWITWPNGIALLLYAVGLAASTLYFRRAIRFRL
jgi:signal peptidase I